MKKILVILSTAALVLTSCATDENKNTTKGAGIGAVAGAAIGAMIGKQQGNTGGGAAIGAVLGAGIGGVVGKRMDNQAKELAKVAETKRTEQGLVTKLKSDILFETGKSDLKAEAKANLTEMATIMKKYPENILSIKGYTDSTGSLKTNEQLSLKRADAVKSHLVASGIPVAVVSTTGMGPSNPVGDTNLLFQTF